MANPLFDLSSLHAAAPVVVASAPAAKKPAPLIWLNIGYTAINADGEEIFVNLPIGVSLDGQTPLEIKENSTPNWKFLGEAKNQLLASLKAVANGLEAGSGVPLPGLTVQMYHRTTAVAAASAPGTNPLLANAPVFKAA